MSLSGKTVAILAEDGYEDLELWYPRIRLEEEGAEVVIVAKGKQKRVSKHAYEVEVDQDISQMDQRGFDGVIVPGGVQAPDRLRRHREILDFVKAISENGKMVATICHGPWVLISAGITKGRQMTCFFAIKDDLVNSGAKYVDAPVIVDGRLVTSRQPKDLPEFCKAIIRVLRT